MLLLHATLNILEKEKKVFDRSLSPFISESTNCTFNETRVRLKQSLVSHLDPAGKVIGEHLPISVSECPDNLRFSKGLLGRHHDDLNAKGLDDNTVSLHTPTEIDSLFNPEELLPPSCVSNRF